jgi:hypothetical protein
MRTIRNCFACGKLELNVLATFEIARRDPNGIQSRFRHFAFVRDLCTALHDTESYRENRITSIPR